MLASTNPTLTALGFMPLDRVVIFHADDLGMCHATLPAYEALLDAGLLSSASVMMPCNWSAAAVDAARMHAGTDVGVHLTLTSEWNTCRWRPLTTPQDAQLVDSAGFFHHTVEEARQTAPATVAAEVRAQLETALAAGLDVTHLDAHMGTAADPRYVPDVVKLSLQYGIPPMIPRFNAAQWQEVGLNAAQAVEAEGLVQQLEVKGLPLVDHIRMLPLDMAGDQTALTLDILRDLPPGITHFILHPAIDTPELRAIAPDWEARVANYQAFTDPALSAGVRDLGVHVIGYRPLRDLLRSRLRMSG